MPPPIKRLGKGLSSSKCRAMLQDPAGSHLFRRMWAAEAWGKMERGRPDCWEVRRDRHKMRQPPQTYFEEVRNGTNCRTNWYEGNDGDLGAKDRLPYFRHDAPALLGFDESIDAFCQKAGGNGGHAWACVQANLNILSLYGDRVPYNICRNLEWQVCAATGKLPGQGSNVILFARAPNSLDPDDPNKPLGQCRGWVPDWPKPAGGVYGYATDDIFFLEVCLFSQICRNGADLFRLRAGDRFYCDFSPHRLQELERWLMADLGPEPPGAMQCYGASNG